MVDLQALKRRANSQKSRQAREHTSPRGNPTKPASVPKLSRRRYWLFRVLAMLLAPLLALGALEGVLRLGGYGYPTGFFKQVRVGEQEFLTENDKFPLRFFPSELARTAEPLRMKEPKPAGTCRIFILGESAAMGDPEPAFGAPRYLEMLLRERFPGAQFEVLNVAVTAINSHVILPIARECARRQGDFWVLYMGNNEMVGPFGAATVFGAQAPPRILVQLALALQQTRLGQLVARLGSGLKAKAPGLQSWGGMQMFLGNQVPPNAPRKERVYENFRKNLQAILLAGRQGGARIILNTVAVNLKDCPPFASASNPNLPAADRARLEQLVAEGAALEEQHHFAEAIQRYGQAARLDSQNAELEFHRGNCLLQLTNSTAARQHLQLACDLDTLPFRADSRINGIIRQAARGWEVQLTGSLEHGRAKGAQPGSEAGSSATGRPESAAPGMVLFDAADWFTMNSPGGVPGQETFYEHVHFTFYGNYRLARAWAEQIECSLPPAVTTRAAGTWASQAACERRLALTSWNRRKVLEGVIRRVQHPPFSTQYHNSRRCETLQSQLEEWSAPTNSAALAGLRQTYLEAINWAPDDYYLRETFANFLVAQGETQAAALQWQQVRERFPWHYVACSRLGGLLAQQGRWAEAEALFLQAAEERPFLNEAWFELGEARAAQGKLELALKDYDHARRLQPQDADCYFYIGQALLQLKRRVEAIENFRRAIQLKPEHWQAHDALAGQLGLEGSFKEAKAEFETVIRLNPGYARAHLNLGVTLMNEGQPQAAARQFQEALRLEPGSPLTQEYLRKALSASPNRK